MLSVWLMVGRFLLLIRRWLLRWRVCCVGCVMLVPVLIMRGRLLMMVRVSRLSIRR
nr:MAG TPA: hypothetical protein [Caudoviricetes sp.]